MPIRRIAIDGPAASGKSAVGTAVARRLGFAFVDTGAIYRAVTWLVLAERLDLKDVDAVTALASSAKIVVGQDPNGHSTVVINGRDATSSLRAPEVEAAVSGVSAIPEVRQHLINIQRRLANGRVVMAGRDIGSVVLPDAELKIFLNASPEERARRRLVELQAEGASTPYPDLVAQLRRRDLLDSTRAAAPLVVPSDAERLETEELSLEAVIDRVLALACRRWPDLSNAAPHRQEPTEEA